MPQIFDPLIWAHQRRGASSPPPSSFNNKPAFESFVGKRKHKGEEKKTLAILKSFLGKRKRKKKKKGREKKETFATFESFGKERERKIHSRNR